MLSYSKINEIKSKISWYSYSLIIIITEFTSVSISLSKELSINLLKSLISKSLTLIIVKSVWTDKLLLFSKLLLLFIYIFLLISDEGLIVISDLGEENVEEVELSFQLSWAIEFKSCKLLVEASNSGEVGLSKFNTCNSLKFRL